MKYIILIALLTCFGAHAAADIVDLTEGPSPQIPPGATIITTKKAKSIEINYVCIEGQTVKVLLAPREGDTNADRLDRAKELLEGRRNVIVEEEKAAAKALRNKPKPPVLKEPAPNAKPIPKTASGASKDTAGIRPDFGRPEPQRKKWYSERTDDLVMFCPLPSLPRLHIEQISQR